MPFGDRAVRWSVLLCLTLCALQTAAVPSSTAHFEQVVLRQPTQLADAAHTSRWSAFSKSLWSLISITHATAAPPASVPVRKSATSEHLLSIHYGRYMEQVVVRFTVRNPSEARALREASDTLFLDIWEASLDWVDIRVDKATLPYLLDLLPDTLQRSHQPLLEGRNLTEAIAATYPSKRRHRDVFSIFNDRKPSSHDVNTLHSNEFFREYRPFSVMQTWMQLIQALFPSYTQRVVVGKSWQGRDIPGLLVGAKPRPSQDDEPSPPRKTIILTGGSHAREWISISTVNYVMYSLITGYGKSQRIDKLLEALDILFVPTLNPDGYVYSWEVDRLWRKTRQPSPIPFCQGIDLDRSWGFQWDTDNAQLPCSESYAGREPFESVETRSFGGYLRNETQQGRMNIVSMVDLHSYSESILMPYSFSCEAEPPALEDLEELGEGISRSIRRTHGEDYQVVSACEGNSLSTMVGSDDRYPRMQTGGGSPLDWFYHEMHVKYSYQIKLRDTGTYGFLLPPEWIIPQGEEILNAVLHLGKGVAGLSVGDEDDEDDDT